MQSKLILAALAAAVLAAASSEALAAQRGTPEYERLVQLKKEQRAQREQERNAPSGEAKGFWAREAERSGLAGTFAMIGNGVDRIIPGEGASTDAK